MKKYFIAPILAFTIFTIMPLTAFAFSGDISINSQNIRFSNNVFLEGRLVRIYVTALNNSNQDLLGVVRFYDNNSQIGSDQSVSLFANKTDDVFVDFVPTVGQHKIAVKLYPWEPELDNPANNWTVTEIFAAKDSDHDGIPNDKDDDDDNDGVQDKEDAFPLNPREQYDTDGDGKGDNNDEDDDNDGVPDTHDEVPLDPNETLDSDKDNLGNIKDDDDDNDGLPDIEEEKLGTNPLEKDTDKDNFNDFLDAFPLDPHEWLDTDKDKIGNNKDIDDDNDGIADDKDDFPLNKGPIIQLKEEDPTIGLHTNYTFDASESYDEDGKIVSYIWEIDGQEKEGNAVNHAFNQTGPHKIKLTVTDNEGEQRSTEYQVSVLNLKLYSLALLTLFVILLAIALYFKYIHVAPKK